MRNLTAAKIVRYKNSPEPAINGDVDPACPEHALELSRTLPHARLVILPGGHGEHVGEICSTNNKMPLLTTAMIEEFLEA